MYDLKKRAYFTNLGELRTLLAGMPGTTEVCVGGVLGAYLHFEKSGKLISFDDEDLDSDYSDDGYSDDALEEAANRELKEHEKRKRLTF